MNDEERRKRISFTSTIANSKDTPPCYLEESVKELEKHLLQMHFAPDRKMVRLKTDIPVFFMRYSSAQPAI
jgi:hypothetical protein